MIACEPGLIDDSVKREVTSLIHMAKHSNAIRTNLSRTLTLLRIRETANHNADTGAPIRKSLKTLTDVSFNCLSLISYVKFRNPL